jgi:hypothetical protein
MLSLVLLAASAAADLDKLDWMSGCHALETPRGVKIEEQWMRPSGGTMLGMNRTTRGGKAVANEFLRIDAKGVDVVYTALVGTKAIPKWFSRIRGMISRSGSSIGSPRTEV